MYDRAPEDTMTERHERLEPDDERLELNEDESEKGAATSLTGCLREAHRGP
jgi:hypothetical protein